MKFCRVCGTEMKDEDLVCSNCGSREEVVDEQPAGAESQTHSFESGVKFCAKCGAKLHQDAVICPNCGCSAVEEKGLKKNSTIITIIKVLMILSCVAAAASVIALAWCIPMTVYAFKALDKGEKFSTTFKVCTLIFVNVIVGVLMLCTEDM